MTWRRRRKIRPPILIRKRGVWIFQIIGTLDHFPAVRGLPRERMGSLILQFEL